MKNTFGSDLSLTIFGESHGRAVGAVLDGMAAGVPVDESFLAACMDKRRARGEIYDASGITLASTSVVWTIWADPSYSSILYTSKTNDDDTVTKTLDPAMCAEVSRELTLRLLSGDGESMDSVDTSSAEYQQQYQTVYDALSRLDSAYVTLATKVNNAVKLSIEKYVRATTTCARCTAMSPPQSWATSCATTMTPSCSSKRTICRTLLIT